NVASSRAVNVLVIARQPDPGKDLPPLGTIPIAERGPGDQRIGGPRAAAQHSVVLAEEGLRVLRVGKGTEARIAVEERRGPLPDRARHVLELVGNRLRS